MIYSRSNTNTICKVYLNNLFLSINLSQKQSFTEFTGKHRCRSRLIKVSRAACNFIKKEAPEKVFSCEFCEILRIHILKSICKRLLLPSLLVWPKEWFGDRDFYELFTFQNKKVSLTKKYPLEDSFLCFAV